jgi:PadR family transcriptional regulator, regulatory protein PadR
VIRARKCSSQTRGLLSAFVARPAAWRHGYELARVTGLQSGTLYPILMRLSDRGLLQSKWQPAEHSGCPPRHLYRLTPQGIRYARAQTTADASPGRWSIPRGQEA